MIGVLHGEPLGFLFRTSSNPHGGMPITSRAGSAGGVRPAFAAGVRRVAGQAWLAQKRSLPWTVTRQSPRAPYGVPPPPHTSAAPVGLRI